MTNQEAIKILDNRAIETTGTLGSLPDSAKETSFLQNDIKAYDMAIEALEKQIPKKPYKDNENGVYEKEYCPTCNRSLFPNEHHCICGQAIGWNEEGNKRLDLMRECGEVE